MPPYIVAVLVENTAVTTKYIVVVPDRLILCIGAFNPMLPILVTLVKY